MKQTICFKYLLSIVFLITLNLEITINAHTYRFCNLGIAPVTVIPDLWGLSSNPDPVTIQPGQSTDFSSDRAIKGACFDSDSDNVSKCGDSYDTFSKSSHSGTTTFSLSQKPTGVWFLTSQDQLINCAVPAPIPPSTDDSSTDSSSNGSSTDGTTATTSASSSTTSANTISTASSTPVSGTSNANCACNIGGQMNPPPTGITFENGDCTQPLLGSTAVSFLSCSTKATTNAPNCACNINGQMSPPPSGVTFANNDCTQPLLSNNPVSFLSCSAASSASTSNPTSSSTGTTQNSGFPSFAPGAESSDSSSSDTDSEDDSDATDQLGQTLNGLASQGS